MIEVSIYYPTVRIVRGVDEPVGEPSADKVRIEFVLPKKPFLFWADYEVCMKIKFPRGYGIAYHDFSSDRLLFAPMPFNILIGFAIWAYHWFRMGFAVWCSHHRPRKEVKMVEHWEQKREELNRLHKELQQNTEDAMLFLDNLDKLIDLVRGGKPDMLLMSRRSRRKLQPLIKAITKEVKDGL